MSSTTRRFMAGMLAIAASIFTSGESHAQVSRMFWITGSGSGPYGLPLPGQEPRFHNVFGDSNIVGPHYGEGTVRTISADPAAVPGKIVGEFGSGSPFRFTNSAGETLACDYGQQPDGKGFGEFELTILGFTEEGGLLVQALWLADFVVLPNKCTGQFRGTTGKWRMTAISEPFVLGSNDPVGYSWEGSGILKLPVRRR